MEQRVYRGSVTPQELAEFLIGQYDPKPDLQAQKFGQGASLMVQIGRGDEPEEIRHAVSLAITRPPGEEAGVVVTMGQQQWLTPSRATFAAMMGLIGLLITPWALFALLWPLSDLIGSTTLPGEIWDSIDTFLASRGALREDRQLVHPHSGQGEAASQ